MTQERSAYFLRSAKRIAQEAVESVKKKEFDRVVRKSQESVELLVKHRLLERGIEPAKTHNIQELAKRLEQKIPISSEDLFYLSEERIPSFYGAEDFIPDQNYDESDGERCLAILRQVKLID